MDMDEKLFAQRLAQLRAQKKVSAREMSLAIGQNPSYINRIENGLCFPSMQCFFYICDYLSISPAEFFQFSLPDPGQFHAVVSDLKRLDVRQLEAVAAVVGELARKG